MLRLPHRSAVLFDMDGVLIDSEPLHQFAEREACRAFHIDPETPPWESFKGKPIEAIAREVFAVAGRSGEDTKGWIEEKYRVFLDIVQNGGVKMFDGAIQAIKHARLTSKTAVVTSSARPLFDAIATSCGWDGLFDVVITGSDIKKGKPDPEPYLLACERLLIEPGEAWVIEDSENGVRSGLAAGAGVVAITNTFSREKLSVLRPDAIIDGLSELSFGSV